MRTLRYSAKFKKDYKRCLKRGLSIGALTAVLELLAKGDTLPSRYRDHELVGGYFGHRECHITPDWLLIYRIDNEEAILTAVRTGSHSDLF
ncbi:MAG: type II toxin-antitoxin system YafQ family toxin [Propionibacteriaceae bacterium]|jgi:mRNA interferase YafQ|nr:type II toxin-antitoxin system YafQ family toxin [Propionibacteriaceae bacterium]